MEDSSKSARSRTSEGRSEQNSEDKTQSLQDGKAYLERSYN